MQTHIVCIVWVSGYGHHGLYSKHAGEHIYSIYIYMSVYVEFLVGDGSMWACLPSMLALIPPL